MTTQTFYTRQMLLQYGKQLLSARRLARYEESLGRGQQANAGDVLARRQSMVERIAHEIIDNLIFSGSENSIVQEVKERLSKELGAPFVFRYPPADRDFKIFRQNEQGGERELPEEEKLKVLSRLWEITLRTVDATML
jgi:hypothetical protein